MLAFVKADLLLTQIAGGELTHPVDYRDVVGLSAAARCRIR